MKIIKDNLDFRNSIRAIQVWHSYLLQDSIFQKSFKPSAKILQQLNLKQFLYYDSTQQSNLDLSNLDNITILNFCNLVMDVYGDEIQAGSFFKDLQSQQDLMNYRMMNQRGDFNNTATVENSLQENSMDINLDHSYLNVGAHNRKEEHAKYLGYQQAQERSTKKHKVLRSSEKDYNLLFNNMFGKTPTLNEDELRRSMYNSQSNYH